MRGRREELTQTAMVSVPLLKWHNITYHCCGCLYLLVDLLTIWILLQHKRINNNWGYQVITVISKIAYKVSTFTRWIDAVTCCGRERGTCVCAATVRARRSARLKLSRAISRGSTPAPISETRANAIYRRIGGPRARLLLQLYQT